MDKSVDNLALLWGGNDPATMRGRLHGERCFTPSWPTLPLPKDSFMSQPTPPGPPTAWPRNAASTVVAARQSHAEAFGSAGCSATYRIKPKYVVAQELS